MSATEIPSRIETRLATSASPIQNAAMNQMFSIITARSNLRILQVRVRPVINHPHPFQRHRLTQSSITRFSRDTFPLCVNSDDHTSLTWLSM